MGKDENRLYCVTLHFLSKKKKTPACLVHHLKCVNFSSNSKFLYDSVILSYSDLCQYKQTKQCRVPCYRYNCELVYSQSSIKSGYEYLHNTTGALFQVQSGHFDSLEVILKKTKSLG